MNINARKRIKSFIEQEGTSPYKFYRLKSKPEFKDNSIEERIRVILTLSETDSSYNASNERVCCSQKWRSSGDIWRHIIYYFPKTSIFSVIKALHKMNDELGGQYCATIRKRTFKLKGAVPGGYSFTNQLDKQLDEYDLYYTQWGNI